MSLWVLLTPTENKKVSFQKMTFPFYTMPTTSSGHIKRTRKIKTETTLFHVSPLCLHYILVCMLMTIVYYISVVGIVKHIEENSETSVRVSKKEMEELFKPEF